MSKQLMIFSAIIDILTIFVDTEIGGQYEFDYDAIDNYISSFGCQAEYEVGKFYVVTKISVGDFISYINLEGYGDTEFNSVCFQFYEDMKPLCIYTDSRFKE